MATDHGSRAVVPQNANFSFDSPIIYHDSFTLDQKHLRSIMNLERQEIMVEYAQVWLIVLSSDNFFVKIDMIHLMVGGVACRNFSSCGLVNLL
jgi:hypothetical protein